VKLHFLIMFFIALFGFTIICAAVNSPVEKMDNLKFEAEKCDLAFVAKCVPVNMNLVNQSVDNQVVEKNLSAAIDGTVANVEQKVDVLEENISVEENLLVKANVFDEEAMHPVALEKNKSSGLSENNSLHNNIEQVDYYSNIISIASSAANVCSVCAGQNIIAGNVCLGLPADIV